MENLILPGFMISIAVIIILLLLLLRERARHNLPYRRHLSWSRQFPRIDIGRKGRDLSAIQREIERDIMMFKAMNSAMKPRTRLDDLSGKPRKRNI